MLKFLSFISPITGWITFYNSLVQLSKHQDRVEKKWFRYHKGSQRRIYFYDLTSAYFKGVMNELAAYGYNRDNKRGKKQICKGLLTAEDGFPLRIQTFKGNTADRTTVPEQFSTYQLVVFKFPNI